MELIDKILSGKNLSDNLLIKQKQLVDQFKSQYSRSPGLVVIIVGNDPASQVYVKNKELKAKSIGINSVTITINETEDIEKGSTQYNLLKEINRLNSNDFCDGILVQLPLPEYIDETLILNSINPQKDVDGFHPENVGRLWTDEKTLIPATPKAVISLIKEYNINISGENVVIVGRSNIVGKPLIKLFLDENATVTIAHSKSNNLKEITKLADILVVAVGVPNLITKEFIKKDAIIIDVGINRTENNKLTGDVDFVDVFDKVKAITPVPGGVGPMTITMLLDETIKAANLNERRKNNDYNI